MGPVDAFVKPPPPGAEVYANLQGYKRERSMELNCKIGVGRAERPNCREVRAQGGPIHVDWVLNAPIITTTLSH